MKKFLCGVRSEVKSGVSGTSFLELGGKGVGIIFIDFQIPTLNFACTSNRKQFDIHQH